MSNVDLALVPMPAGKNLPTVGQGHPITDVAVAVEKSITAIASAYFSHQKRLAIQAMCSSDLGKTRAIEKNLTLRQRDYLAYQLNCLRLDLKFRKSLVAKQYEQGMFKLEDLSCKTMSLYDQASYLENTVIKRCADDFTEADKQIWERARAIRKEASRLTEILAQLG